MIRPGAVSRASGGVLFLDEAPEFSSGVLDALRQPLESGTVVIHRSHAVAEFPAQFQLVLAANPCPCGRWDAQRGDCSCPSLTRRRYLGRMSGPLRDRIDLDVWVPRVSSAMLRYGSAVGGVSTAVARTRVEAARQTAAERLRETPWRTNAQMSGAWLRGKGRLHPGGRATVDLDRALERGELTMRGYDQTLKVAWTAADLDGATSPGADHVGRALTYRSAA